MVCRWLLRRLKRFEVSGRSMLPLLAPGEEVLVDPRAAVVIGDIVVARHPYRSDVRLVKCLIAFDDAGRLQLEGLNLDESTDSRSQGNFPRQLLLGKVIGRFASEK